MSALGRRQLDLLKHLAHPGLMLIVPNAVSLSLERRGLLKARGGPPPPGHAHRGFQSITPAGLRALADAYDARRIRPPDPKRKGGKADG